MSFWADLRSAVKTAFLVHEDINRLSSQLDATTNRVAEHDRRLIRLETIIEIASASRSRHS